MPTVDLEKLRLALRRLTRGDLLTIAERATELVPRAKLAALLGDLVRLEVLAGGKGGVKPLLDEVRKFHAAVLHRDYYDSFGVNSRNFMDKSEGTEEFVADFERLIGKCIRAVENGPRPQLREAFDLLFALLRRLDSDPDSIVFFADEAGSWQVDVDWQAALPAYFRCLAEGTPADEYARVVHQAIEDFADRERPRHLAAARRVANAEQKAALRRLPKREGRG
ncbi:MAG TPA: hypothetical protein VMK12_25975 [Anaeromyxobacteraceae bacterium]|nr:hypothetical protein [Anaeromyxobacteraceae bacterium]